MSTDIVIVAAARTAVGKFGGTLAKTPAAELGATVLKALLERARLQSDQVDEVILGQVLQAGCGQNPARQALIKAGLSQATPAMTINKVCGSGLKAVMPMWYWLYTSHRPSVIMVSISFQSPMRWPSREPGSTWGDMLMLSWPPATTICESPSRMACAASITALRPEPHTLLIVIAGVACDRPALMRA